MTDDSAVVHGLEHLRRDKVPLWSLILAAVIAVAGIGWGAGRVEGSIKVQLDSIDDGLTTVAHSLAKLEGLQITQGKEQVALRSDLNHVMEDVRELRERATDHENKLGYRKAGEDKLLLMVDSLQRQIGE